MEIQLSDHFTYKKLIKFVLPSIVMMIFTSIYGVVDGLFVSNFAGKTAFAAINLIMPILMGLSALGFMIGTGGSAIVATTLGEGKKEKANEYFSMLVYVTIIGGIAVSILGMILIRPVAVMLGAAGELLSDCVLYGRITFISFPAFYAAECVSELFCSSTETKTWAKSYHCGGCDQHGSGLFVCGTSWIWNCRGSSCDSMRRIYRRIVPDFLFCTKKFKSSETWKTKF